MNEYSGIIISIPGVDGLQASVHQTTAMKADAVRVAGHCAKFRLGELGDKIAEQITTTAVIAHFDRQGTVLQPDEGLRFVQGSAPEGVVFRAMKPGTSIHIQATDPGTNQRQFDREVDALFVVQRHEAPSMPVVVEVASGSTDARALRKKVLTTIDPPRLAQVQHTLGQRFGLVLAVPDQTVLGRGNPDVLTPQLDQLRQAGGVVIDMPRALTTGDMPGRLVYLANAVKNEMNVR